MGTRADFYIGRGRDAEWIGSIGLDGYPDGTPAPALSATSETEFREIVAKIIETCGSGTRPDQGWPWPWNDSRTTDYAYALDGGRVHASTGGPWFDPADDSNDRPNYPEAEFPDMSARKNVTFGPRSGLIVVGF